MTYARRDNRQYVERLATEAEAVVEQKDVNTVCHIPRKLRGDRGQNRDLNLKAKDGSTISEERVKLERWRWHFLQLNRCDLPSLADISEAEQDQVIKCGPITFQEVNDEIKKQKNGKPPGTTMCVQKC